LGDRIDLGRNIFLDKRTSELHLGSKKIPIRRFVTTKYSADMRLQKSVKLLDYSSDISIIYMADYNTMLVLDEQSYNSLYVQLFILQNYDKKLFEPVILSPGAKVYKLKI